DPSRVSRDRGGVEGQALRADSRRAQARLRGVLPARPARRDPSPPRARGRQALRVSQVSRGNRCGESRVRARREEPPRERRGARPAGGALLPGHVRPELSPHPGRAQLIPTGRGDSMHRLIALFPLAIVLVLLGPAAAGAQGRGKEIVVGLGAEPRTMLAVTIVDWTTNNILEHIYDRLLDRDANAFKPKPMP